MLQTPLNAFHRECGAKLVDFAGWEMPVVYRGIIEEHHYTRQHGAAFDVSHMGRLEIRGGDAEAFLQNVCTRNVGNMPPGLSRYSHVCKEDGGILDDIIVSRHAAHFGVVCNASNREKILAWFDRHKTGLDVQIADRTAETAMVAIQGPEVIETMDRLLPFPVSDLKRYHFKTGSVMGVEYIIYRSGYTGEDGVEVVIPAQFAQMAARTLMDQSAEMGRPILPAGLGARDTLRMEAAMPLYGHELTEDADSLSAGQGWAVDLKKDFIGCAAMRRVQEQGLKRKVAGFELEGKRIARQGASILKDGREAGIVTSGTHSPTFDQVIAMGFLDAALCEPGTPVEIDIRGSRGNAKVVPLPFYKRAK